MKLTRGNVAPGQQIIMWTRGNAYPEVVHCPGFMWTGPKSRCSLLAYINIWKELLLSCLRDKAKIARFFKIIELLLWLSPPGQTPEQDRRAKTRPLGQLKCANPRGPPRGMVRLGIDWYINLDKFIENIDPAQQNSSAKSSCEFKSTSLIHGDKIYL